MSRPYPRHISYICSHHFSGTVTFEHLISVTEIRYKLGFTIYHVEDVMRYLRNLSRPYTLSRPNPLDLYQPQSSQ